MWAQLANATFVAMVGPAMDELLASFQYLRRERAFWGLGDRR